MRICRTRLTRDYAQTPNALAQDGRLTHMARGCLVELLSRPQGWRITADEMWEEARQSQGPRCPGRRVYRAAWAELKEHGYLSADRCLLEGGRYATVLTARNIPVRPGSSGVDEAVDNPSTDVPPCGTSAPPAVSGVSAGQTDVPAGGTSTTKDGLKKKTGKTPTNGHRPSNVSTGPGSSGCAAKIGVGEIKQIGAVLCGLPEDLRSLLPELVPATITETIRAELARGLSGDELTLRAGRRWFQHGYAAAGEEVGGPGIRRPVGAAVALLRQGNCTSDRCNDGQDLDTGGYCRTCEREAADRRTARETADVGEFPTPAPARLALVPAQPTPARRDRGWRPLVNCDGCDRAHRPAEPGKLCPGCRVEEMARAPQMAG